MGLSKEIPPFRAEHIGSLLRPRELTEAYRNFQDAKLTLEAFRRLQNRCIEEAVRLQEEVGLHSITDGEFRRRSYYSHFLDAIRGFTVKESVFAFHDERGEIVRFQAPHVAGKLKRERGIATEDFQFLKSVTRRTPKLTMPSPSTMHFFRGRAGVDAVAYADHEEFFADLVRLFREELQDLVAVGATYIQMDEVPLAMLCDPHVRESVRARGEDPEWLTQKYIQITNAVLRDRPQQLRVAMHLCRGNYKAKWLAEGGYEPVAERLFNELSVDAFMLEYDASRAGDFQPLRHLPANKMAVLGLVSTKTPQLEEEDSLKRRLETAARFVPLERLGISPQCGFASTVGGNPLRLEDQIRKLRLVVRLAKQVWGEQT